MARYIDVDKLIEVLNEFDMTETNNASYDCGYEDCLVAVQDAISDIPTADVVEVVRCKDCKFAGKMITGDYSCVVDHRLSHNEHDFCSYGERKQKNDFKE